MDAEDTSRKILDALTELSPQQVDFDNRIVKDELCPKLWTPMGELHPEVHERLLDLGKRFASYIGVEVPEDILFTGSLCNFNYHDDSDIDIHVMTDFAQLGDPELVRGMYQAKKYAFNDFRKGTTIRGYPIECYAQDIPAREPHHPSGLYSLLHNKWIIRPEKITPQIDEQKVRKLLSIFINAINYIEEIEDNQERLERAIELKDNLIKLRRESVRGAGEYSPGNLCFKMLRRQGHLEKLFTLIREAMDRKLSLEQRELSSEKIIQEGTGEITEKTIRELIRKELEPLLKQYFSTRPILSKVEIERIADDKVKRGLVAHPNEQQIRQMVRQILVNQYHWFWDKRNTWVNQI